MHNGTHASLRMRHKVSLWPANFVNHSLVRILAAVRVGETLCDVYTTSCWCLEKNHTRFWFELCFDSVWNGAVQSLFSTDTIELSKYVRGTRGAHDTRETCPPSQAGVRPFCSLLGPSLKLRTTRSHEENDACQSPASEMSPSDAARHASFGIVGYWLKRQFLHFHKVHLCRSVRPCLWYLPKWEQTSPLVKVFWIPRGMKTIIEEE